MHSCHDCRYLDTQIVDDVERSFYGYGYHIKGEIMIFWCDKTMTALHRLERGHCADFRPKQKTKLVKYMVEINQLPMEKDRVDLSTLPQENELMAVSEEWVEAQPDKTGGLVIHYKDRDGGEFPQKYSAISGKSLNEALSRLGVKDTEELQKAWFKYRLTPMRVGYPRYIPTARAEATKKGR